ncbi:hypothetical protein GCM10009798_32450 [Nocardioides panacihumi]|uniref:Glycosyltransferase subfamily 4-like N-terminal domain-containing protein n=1 Tax=Nocardioides panacihumi TaxID=400774 RepID=A0ABN2RHV2_9ACTN
MLIGLAGLQLGGCQINAVDLARELRRLGHDVSLFAVADDSVELTILPYAEAAGFSVVTLPVRPGLRDSAREIAALADARDADVVHVFAPWLARPLGVAAAGWSRRAAVETNWNMVNAFWGSPRVPLVVGTGAMRDEAQQRRRAAVHLMEPPVDQETDRPDPAQGAAFRAQHGVAPDDFLAVVVSRLDREMKAEGILLTIDALERTAGRDLRLAVVGDGDATRMIADAADRANARLGRKAVLLTGALLDPHPAYAAADVVLGMGGAAIRGLAHGKPVVVLGERGFFLPYDVKHVRHFRREGFYGIGGPLRPADELARLLESLSADDLRRARMARFGLEDVDRRFGLGAATRSLVDIYRAALDAVPGRLPRSVAARRIIARDAAASLRARVSRRSS